MIDRIRQILKEELESIDVQQDVIPNELKERMTIVGDDFIGYHYSYEVRDVIKTNGKTNRHSKNDFTTWGRSRAFYYTNPNEGEGMIGGYLHEVLIPLNKIYPLNSDPLGFRQQAIDNRNGNGEFVVKYEEYTKISIEYTPEELSGLNPSGIKEKLNAIIDIMKVELNLDLKNSSSNWLRDGSGYIFLEFPGKLEDNQEVKHKIEQFLKKDVSMRYNEPVMMQKPFDGLTYKSNMYEQTAIIASQHGYIGFIYLHENRRYVVISWEDLPVSKVHQKV